MQTGRLLLRWIGRGFCKLNFSEADFRDGELHEPIPLNAVDRHVGHRMRSRRTYLRMTEECLAEAIGVRPFDIWAFEEGKSRIGFDALLAVAKALRVSERYFYKDFWPRDVAESLV